MCLLNKKYCYEITYIVLVLPLFKLLKQIPRFLRDLLTDVMPLITIQLCNGYNIVDNNNMAHIYGLVWVRVTSSVRTVKWRMERVGDFSMCNVQNSDREKLSFSCQPDIVNRPTRYEIVYEDNCDSSAGYTWYVYL